MLPPPKWNFIHQDGQVTNEKLKSVMEDCEKFFTIITMNDKKSLHVSWTLIYKNRNALIQEFEKSFTTDEMFTDDSFIKVMLEKVQVSLIIDAFNTIVTWITTRVKNLSRTETYSISTSLSKSHISMNTAIDDDVIEPVDNETFEKIFQYLVKIGFVHKKLGIDKQELLLARKHFLKTLKHRIGTAWNSRAQSAWMKLTNLVQVCIMSAFQLSKPEIIIPHDDQFSIARNTWEKIEENNDAALNVLFNALNAESSEIAEFFPTIQSLKPLTRIGSFLSLSNNLEMLNASLETLGKAHVAYNVQGRHFKVMDKCWMIMLKEIIGFEFTASVETAWKAVFTYMGQIMQDSLDKYWMLQPPAEPQELTLDVKINQIDKINPSSLQFEADLTCYLTSGHPRTIKTAFTNKRGKGNIKFKIKRQKKTSKHKTTNFSDNDKLNSNDKASDTTDMKKDKQSDTNKVKKRKKQRPDWDMNIRNIIDSKEIFKLSREKTVAQTTDGSWVQRKRIVGHFNQAFDMQDFPFDKYLLKFEFEFDCSTSQARIDQENVFVSFTNANNIEEIYGLGGTDWDVFPPSATVKRIRNACKVGNQAYYYQCVVSVPIARKWKSKFYQILIPLAIFDIISFCVYMIEPEPIFYRMTTVATLLFTLFSFKQSVGESMPQVPYFTHLNYHFYITSTFVLVHMFVGAMYTHYSVEHNSYNRFVDRLIAIIIFGLFLIIKGWISYHGWTLAKKQHSFLDHETGKVTSLDTVTQETQNLVLKRQQTLNARKSVLA